MRRHALALLLPVMAASVVGGCLSIKTEHEIKPIHITMDVNLKMQKELDKAFDGGTPAAGQSAELQKIKDRMKARRPALIELRKAGVIGEGNTGLAVLLKPTADEMQKALVEIENADRTAVYADVAKQTNTTIAEAGRARQIRLMEILAEGTQFQQPDGTWKAK